MIGFIKEIIVRCIEKRIDKYFGTKWQMQDMLKELLQEDVTFKAYLERMIDNAVNEYDPSKDMEANTNAIRVILKENADRFLGDKLAEKVVDTMTSEHVAKLIDRKTLNNMIQAKIAFELGNGVKALTSGDYEVVKRNHW